MLFVLATLLIACSASDGADANDLSLLQTSLFKKKKTSLDQTDIALTHHRHIPGSFTSGKERIAAIAEYHARRQQKGFNVLLIVLITLIVMIFLLVVCGCSCLRRSAAAGEKLVKEFKVTTVPAAVDKRKEVVKHEKHSNLLGELVELVLETIDVMVLGVHLELGAVKIEPLRGRIEISDLVVNNFPGYCKEHLLEVATVRLDIDMQKLLFSRGKDVCVTELCLEDLRINYERAFLTSNLHDLVQHLEGLHMSSADTTDDQEEKEKIRESVRNTDEKEAQDTKAENGPRLKPKCSCFECVKGLPASDARCCNWKPKAGDRKFAIEKLTVTNVGISTALYCAGGLGVSLVAGDIKYANFSEEVGGIRSLQLVIPLILSTIIKSVISTVGGAVMTAANEAVQVTKATKAAVTGVTA